MNAQIAVDHPGSFIKEELDARGWAQTDLAFVLDMSPQHLNPILSGKHSITASMAMLLGDAFGMPAEFFSNLQTQYDLSVAHAPPPGVRKRAVWQSAFPIREMMKRGWIEESDASLLDTQMLRFFEKNRIDDVPYVGNNGAFVAHAAKKTTYADPTPEELAWLCRVRQVAKEIVAPKYSRVALAQKMEFFKTLLNSTDEVASVVAHLRECGVRLVIVETLPRAKIDGVCTWLDDQPVIALTARFDRLDNFWFVLRHECEHVLCEHGRDNGFAAIDNLEGEAASTSGVPEEERIANTAAANFCVPQDQLKSFIARKSPYISERDIIGFSRRLEIHPAIVVGQLQHATKNWAFLRKYLSASVSGVRERLVSELKNSNVVDGWGITARAEL